MIIEAKRYRTQEQNRVNATQWLIPFILKAIAKPVDKTKKNQVVKQMHLPYRIRKYAVQ